MLRLKKYEGLVCNEKQEISEINHIVGLPKDLSGAGEIKQSNRSTLTKAIKKYTYWGICWKFVEFGHLAKEGTNFTWILIMQVIHIVTHQQPIS